mmetsp:Transcript_21330/g.69028  ORF Transcript_21330/g.69028 Transcript_21330/m.69028 type:complete len:507 (+) Transcript_21330:281-1801(+)
MSCTWSGASDEAGMPTGDGVLELPTGDRFTGVLKAGTRVRGRYEHASAGAVFEGEYDTNGKRARGTLVYTKEGDRYEGTFDGETGLPDGEGVMVYANGDVYRGGFRRGRREGKGSYTYRAGGELRAWFFHGGPRFGSFTQASFATYRGPFDPRTGEYRGRGLLWRDVGGASPLAPPTLACAKVHQGSLAAPGEVVTPESGARNLFPPRRRGIIIAGFDDDAAESTVNPLKAVSGRLKLASFRKDCGRMKVFLTEWLGWDESEVETLVCDEHTRPEDVTAVFERARAALGPASDVDGHIIVYYSGHGTRSVDLDGDEAPEEAAKEGANNVRRRMMWRRTRPNTFDECMAVNKDCIIPDDLIHHNLDFRAHGPLISVFALFDCCHSGTIADLAFKWITDAATGELRKERARPPGSATRLQSVVSLSGCQDSEESMTSAAYGGIGMLTDAFLEAVAADPNMSIHRLFKRVAAEVLRATNWSQHPLLCSSFEISAQATLTGHGWEAFEDQ